MRIAIPVRGNDVFSPMGGAEAFHFYEDDHGRIMRQLAGVMLFPGASGKADDAALGFLSGSVVSDPSNHCNACGFKGACSLKDKGGCGK